MGSRSCGQHHGSRPAQAFLRAEALRSALLRYSVRRLLGAIPTLLLLVAASFFMMRAVPGGPFDTERKLPPEVEANLRAAYHLDEPLYRQFGRYLMGLARLDFGPSF